MLTQSQLSEARKQALEYFARAGIILTPQEAASIEVADFGLSDLQRTGLQLVTYVNTQRVCAKELVLFPNQTCPEHRHPPVGSAPGKEETFRCRWGEVYLYVEGDPADKLKARAEPPAGREQTYTVWREIRLRPGQQFTIHPDTRHWFQAGPKAQLFPNSRVTAAMRQIFSRIRKFRGRL